jgi:hypothetical protein
LIEMFSSSWFFRCRQNKQKTEISFFSWCANIFRFLRYGFVKKCIQLNYDTKMMPGTTQGGRLFCIGSEKDSWIIAI